MHNMKLHHRYMYLSIERAARVQMEQFIVSHCHMYCNLHGMTPNFQLSCSSS